MAEEIIDEYGDELQTILLVRGGSGQFVVTVNGEQIFSKKDAGRHANPGEIVDLMQHIPGNGQAAGADQWRPAGS